jgi:hypothetical protein
VIGGRGFVKVLETVVGSSAVARDRIDGSAISPPSAVRRDSDGRRILFIVLLPGALFRAGAVYDGGIQLVLRKLVAGAGFEPATFGL